MSKILIIEDDVDLCQTTSDFLKKEGYDVVGFIHKNKSPKKIFKFALAISEAEYLPELFAVLENYMIH